MLSVGEIFSKTREKRGIDLNTVEKEIRVRKRLLIALEKNDWSAFSSKIYIAGVIKNYARFLGLSHSKMLAFFRRDYERSEDMQFKKRIETGALKPPTKTIIWSIILCIILLFASYFTYQIYEYITPPEVVLREPQKDRFRSVERITIVGTTEPDATVSVFDGEIIPNNNGTFTFDLPLNKGENDFRVTVRGANGKETTLRRVFVLE